MAEDDDLEVFRRARPEPQEQQLQDALNRDVNNGQNHGTSGNTTRSPLFYADRINAPYRPRTYAVLFSILAGIGLILATIGVYGVMTYAVAQSTRELGVRLALGAQRREILTFVLCRTGILVGVGIATGLMGALAATRYLQGMLFGLSPIDPLTFGASALLFVATAMLASYVPARRAMRIDPIVALRYE